MQSQPVFSSQSPGRAQLHGGASFFSALGLCLGLVATAPSAFAFGPAPAASFDVPAPGFSAASSPNPAFGAPLTSLPGGDFVTFDGTRVERWNSQGVLVQNLGTLPASTFPSFVVAEPSGAAVVIGESTNHELYRVPTDGSGPTPLAFFFFNYDGAFSPSGELYVSGAAGGFGQGNDIFRVELPSGVLHPVAHVAGPSGPIAFDAAGNLYYATQGIGFPAPADSTDVIRWNAFELPLGNLTELDAVTLCSGLDGGGSLAVEPLSQRVYLAETSFLFGTNFVRRIGNTPAASPIVVDTGSLSIHSLHFVAGAGPATFDAFQPANGSRMVYGATDFFSASQRCEVRPARPQLSLSGPGLTGPGTVTLTVTGGVPGGSAYLLHCAQSSLLPGEVPVQFPTFLLHTPFVLSAARRVPFYIPADAGGTSVYQIYNPGGLQGTRAYQFLVAGPTGTFVGSTNAAQF
jgi:hypothetical protein